MNHSDDIVLNIINAIELNLQENFSLTDLAAHLHLSITQLQNLFIQKLGFSIGDYMKKRRLTEIANQLITTDKPILHLAVDYNYSSQASFSRAFKQHFGISPLKYRLNKQHRYYCYYHQLTAKDLDAIDSLSIDRVPTIKTLPSFTLDRVIPPMGLTNYDDVMIWKKLCETHHLLSSDPHHKVYTFFEYADDIPVNELTFPNETSQFSIGILPDAPCIIKNVTLPIMISDGKYAVFEYSGSRLTLSYAYKYIFSVWLPGTAYKVRESFDFEIYHALDAQSFQVSLSIYVPIK